MPSSATGVPTIVISGEQSPDAELMSHSTVPAGVALQTHVYLAQGGVTNLRTAARLPERHVAHDGLRLLAAGVHPGVGGAGVSRGPRPHQRRSARGRPLLSRAAPGRQHRLRRRAVPRDRRCGRPTRAHLRRVAAHAGTGTARAAGNRRRIGDDGAGRGRSRPCHRHRRRCRRHLERGAPRGAEHPDPAGALPDVVAEAVERQRRRDEPARRGDPGGRARVRRPHHHGAVLVQGDRRRRPDLLRRRPGTVRPGRGSGGAAGQASPHRARGQASRAGVLRLPHQARAHRQRRRPRHTGQRHRAADGDARRRLPDR